MANVILTDLRRNIRTQILALPGLADMNVFDASSADHVFALAEVRRPASSIGIVCTSMAPTSNQEIGQRSPKFQSFTWELVIVCSSYQSAAGAQTKAMGCDEIAEKLLALRGVDVKPAWIGDAVYLEYRRAAARFPTFRVPQVGEVGWGMTWETTEVEM